MTAETFTREDRARLLDRFEARMETDGGVHLTPADEETAMIHAALKAWVGGSISETIRAKAKFLLIMCKHQGLANGRAACEEILAALRLASPSPSPAPDAAKIVDAIRLADDASGEFVLDAEAAARMVGGALELAAGPPTPAPEGWRLVPVKALQVLLGGYGYGRSDRDYMEAWSALRTALAASPVLKQEAEPKKRDPLVPTSHNWKMDGWDEFGPAPKIERNAPPHPEAGAEPKKFTPCKPDHMRAKAIDKGGCPHPDFCIYRGECYYAPEVDAAVDALYAMDADEAAQSEAGAEVVARIIVDELATALLEHFHNGSAIDAVFPTLEKARQDIAAALTRARAEGMERAAIAFKEVIGFCHQRCANAMERKMNAAIRAAKDTPK